MLVGALIGWLVVSLVGLVLVVIGLGWLFIAPNFNGKPSYGGLIPVGLGAVALWYGTKICPFAIVLVQP